MIHEDFTDRDGIPWHDAPTPRRWHRCRPWTTGWLEFTQIDRCACGAIRKNGKAWEHRNSRAWTPKQLDRKTRRA